MNDESTTKCEWLDSTEIKICEIFENAEPSIKSTSRGIMIDLRAELRNEDDSMRFSRESFLNEIDESDRQYRKHDEHRDLAFRGMMIDLIGWLSKEPWPTFATRRVAPERGRRRMTEQ
jgi:hypothetical protein